MTGCEGKVPSRQPAGCRRYGKADCRRDGRAALKNTGATSRQQGSIHLLESLQDIGDQGAGEILGEAPEGWGIFLEKAG
jgi:hypothetical protein